MSASDSRPPAKARRIRHDGWTAERQLQFLDALARTHNVRDAAAHARMSRESAYRLRGRREGALFALLWDRILAPAPPQSQVHTNEFTIGQIMRLLGNHYRRERGDFLAIRGKSENAR